MKKGALELSITAIVILIIAITVLGFAIFFIKSLFQSGQEILAGEIAKVKDKLRDDFASGGQSVGINIGTDIHLQSGKFQDMFIGIKNNEPRAVCYGLKIQCLKSTSEENYCESEIASEDGTVGGIDADDPSNVWFKNLFSSIAIEGNDISVLPTRMQIPTRAGKNTFQTRLLVFKETTVGDQLTSAEESGRCDIDFTSDGELYETLPFFITVE